MTATAEASAPIGGFFERHAPLGGDGPSVIAAWTAGRPHAAFVSARAAFAALANLRPEAAVWSPAFVCADVLEGIAPDRVRLYPVREGFTPDLSDVEAQACPGDFVLLVAHFGLPVAVEARDFAVRRRDLTVVEDRAQALGPSLPTGGGYELYSPRKLMGVADGGILVAPMTDDILPTPRNAADAEALWRAAELRHADPAGRENARWHAANQAKEAAMSAAPLAMTAQSRAILAETPIGPLARTRLANWRTLDARLRRWSALPAEVEHPPLGYVLRLEPEARDSLLGALHAARIFAAVHWPRIAAPASLFPREAGWTRELVTLPCDHRYGPAEMGRIADVVEAALA